MRIFDFAKVITKMQIRKLITKMQSSCAVKVQLTNFYCHYTESAIPLLSIWEVLLKNSNFATLHLCSKIAVAGIICDDRF